MGYVYSRILEKRCFIQFGVGLRDMHLYYTVQIFLMQVFFGIIFSDPSVRR